MPRVSIIMNVRNGASFLREALDSVMAQTFQDWELIVWDDRSTDDSSRIVAEYFCQPALPEVIVGVAEIDQSLTLLAKGPEHILAGCLTAKVNHRRTGGVEQLVPFPVQAVVVGQIGHGPAKALVQQADGFPGGAADEVRGSTDAFYRLGLGIVEIRIVITVHQPAFGKQPVQIEGLQKEDTRAREAANVVLDAAVGIKQLRPADRSLGMFVHEAHQRFKRVLDH